MGFIGKTILFVAGVGLGYYAAPNCQEITAWPQRTTTVSAESSSVVQPAELSIDYVIAVNFEGMLFTSPNGRKGFLAHNQWPAEREGHLSYIELESELTSPVRAVTLYRPHESVAPASEGFLSTLLTTADHLAHKYLQ